MSPQTFTDQQELARLRHDCRNSINQIIGYAEILMDETSDAGQEQSALRPDLARILEAGRVLLPQVEEAFGVLRREIDGGAPALDGDAPPPVAAPPSGESAEAGRDAPPGVAADSGSPLETGRILVVDDSAENRDLLTRRLMALGHTCAAEADGLSAIARMRQEEFDVVLLDIIMPGMNGFDALQVMKSDPALASVPVIMISAVEEFGTVARCIEIGAADYLTKPFNSIILRARIGACLRDKRSRDRAEMLFRELTENYERERRITGVLQGSLIQDIPVGEFPGLSVASLYEAAWSEAQVGGDVFDAFALPSGRVALAVGDASGKGLAAAARIAQVKFALRAYAREFEERPAEIVTHLNELLSDANRFAQGDIYSFVALALALYDPATGGLEIVCAGCEPPLVLRGGSDASDQIVSESMPLGISADAEYEVVRQSLEPGDALLMLTDGITEARHGNEFLGYPGMVRMARAAFDAHANVCDVTAAILDGARSFGGGTLRDDACMLLTKRS